MGTVLNLILSDVPTFQQQLYTVIIWILAVINSVFFLWALFLGYKLIRADDENKRREAKRRVTQAIVAILIILIFMGVLITVNFFVNMQYDPDPGGGFGPPPA